MDLINFTDFLKVEIRVGTVVSAEAFPQARKPAYILHLDMGSELGLLKSSAQITDNYSIEDLIGKQVVVVVNFPKKQIGPIQSDCLVTGFHQPNHSVVLCTPDAKVPNGTRLL